jgi:hypothetical protein
MNNRLLCAANSSMVGHGGGRNNCGRFDCARSESGRIYNMHKLPTGSCLRRKDQASVLDLGMLSIMKYQPLRIDISSFSDK